MIGALLDRLLQGVGLGGHGRIDLLNLAQNRAANLWPHRALAALTTLLTLVLGAGMFREWRDMNAHRPGAGKSALNMRDELDKTQFDIEARKHRIDPKKAQALGAGVREANLLIMQRAVAPTDMLSDLEAVKPFGGRFVGLRRAETPGGAIALAFRLKSPQRKIYEEFAARIGRARRFSGLSLKSETTQNGEFEAELEMLWAPGGAPEVTELPPKAEPAVTRSGAASAPSPAAVAGSAAVSAPPAARPVAAKPAPRIVVRRSPLPAAIPARGAARPAPRTPAKPPSAPAGKTPAAAAKPGGPR